MNTDTPTRGADHAFLYLGRPQADFACVSGHSRKKYAVQTVEVRGKTVAVACGCLGFHYRGRCSHIDALNRDLRSRGRGR